MNIFNFPILKSRLKVFLATLLYLISKCLPYDFSINWKGKTRVLVFHHIDDIYRFRSIIASLKKNYHLISFSQYIAEERSKDKLNIIISLDDGYKSWYVNAFSIFLEYDIHPIIFVNSDFIGLSQGKSLAYSSVVIKTWGEPSLSWDELACLRKIGTEVGGHTIGHNDLTAGLDMNVHKYSIIHDRKTLAENLKCEIRSFAYPYGRYNGSSIKLVEEAGYTYGFTSDSGYLDESEGPLLLKRTNVGLRHAISVRAIAEGWLDIVTMIVKLVKMKN